MPATPRIKALIIAQLLALGAISAASAGLDHGTLAGKADRSPPPVSDIDASFQLFEGPYPVESTVIELRDAENATSVVIRVPA